MSWRLGTRTAIVLGLLALATAPLSAQEVQWRHDYAAARTEAAQTGKPLLLDFGTENCMWCRKLDATTFRSKPVVDALNARFIPVKVDANKAPKLVQALGIEGYPEVIAASPDGTILGRHPGYADTNEMSKMLSGALQRMPKPAAPVAAAPVPTVTPVAAAMSTPPAITQTVFPPVTHQLAVPSAPAEKWDETRDEIARKLTQVYLDRGAELCRRGRSTEGGQYLGVAATLSPESAPAGTAREMLDKLHKTEGVTRP